MTIKAENTIDFEDIRQLNKSGLSSVKIMLGSFIAAMVVLLVISLCTGNSGRNLKGESGYLCAYSDDRGNPFFELIEFCCHCAL